MDPRAEQRARAVLHVIANLSPSEQQGASGDTISLDWFRWLPAKAANLVQTQLDPRGELRLQQPVAIERRLGSELAAIRQVRGNSALVIGWLFVAGHIELDGRMQRVFRPLVTVPATIDRPKTSRNAFVAAIGDSQITPMVTDRAARNLLENEIAIGGGALDAIDDIAIPAALLGRLGQLNSFAVKAAAAAGYSVKRVVPAGASPAAAMRSNELVVLAGAAIYSAEDGGFEGATDWPANRLGVPTAFHALYLGEGTELRAADENAIGTATVLSPAQRDAVIRTRREAITVVSGAPGTGKSHTITAMATDAISRGESVLVAAKTDSTVDALIDLLHRVPGPTPVVFGSSARRDALAERLSAGQLQVEPDSEVREAARRRRAADAALAALRCEIVEQLRLESAAQRDDDYERLRGVAPGCFDDDRDLDLLDDLVRRASKPVTGWLSGRRRRRAWRLLVANSGARQQPDLAALAEAIQAAGRRRRIAKLVAGGGVDLDEQWERLVITDAAARDATGRWLGLAARSDDRLDHKALGAVSALATALRSGRAARRAQLASFADDRLSHALPLWVGTLPDIDDLLPPVPQLFDLVILDESSSIEQRTAIPALLRARRAAIVGDPRQLRHVSFVSDETIRTEIHNAGLDVDPMLASKLDVRRNSIFDVAVGASTVTSLDEHFRSDPHLIDFVGRHVYLNQFSVATRAPSTQSRDCVDVIRLPGHRDANSVVIAEVQRIVTELRTCLRDKLSSVGVVTPFRSQADALEAAVLNAFTADELESLDLRVGTVHGFQGVERDVMYCSLGIGDDDPRSPWTFVDDPHLLAVFLTRARRRLVFVHSADPPPGSLLAGYLAAVDQPPGPPSPSYAAPSWSDPVLDDLERQGFVLYRNYPVGRHVLDAAALVGGRNAALIFNVHNDGIEAHIDRQLALRHGGWIVIESFPSRWSERLAELALDLIARLRPGPR
jgi:hypothetical protein